MSKNLKEIKVRGSKRADWDQFVGRHFTLGGSDKRVLVELPADQTEGSTYGRLVLEPSPGSEVSETFVTDPNDGDAMNWYLTSIFLVTHEHDPNAVNSSSDSEEGEKKERKIAELEGEVLMSSLGLIVVIFIQLLALAARK